ncbi:MAG TPA: glycoside hydrolase family 3 C-terminal domain-containing protein [Blastocatellia bacterium]|nr:glycoside hydrolase family 3 C-terminal domain-containing protein [Blastocatellia bacterium]
MKMMKAVVSVLLSLVFSVPLAAQTKQSHEPLKYKDPRRPIEERVGDLVSRMTLEEKVSQMIDRAPAIARLDIPAYNWWNESLHGVARAGVATVFPQAIGLAATWNTDLMHRVADVISTEARAKHHEAVRHGDFGRYKGLTFWSPNINIFRDPRWGRGQETYGEDPYLTARMGVQFVRGLQGDDPRYFKVISTAKHFAVHSGPELDRHRFDAVADQRDLYETYLPAFEALVREAGADSVMCAYNRFLGEACCASDTLERKILRADWRFKGYVVSDCGAITDIYAGHKLVPTVAEASALAVKRGTDLSCGQEYTALVDAVKRGLISEAEIDVSLKRLMTARFRLGMFDPPEMVPYTKIPITQNDTPEHRELALEAARQSIVLLKNANGLLPLKHDLKKIAVIGPTADDAGVLLGNYNGTPSRSVTLLAGIRNKFMSRATVLYEKGCDLVGGKPDDKAVQVAADADVVIFVGGITPRVEGEEMKVEVEGFRGGDRTDIRLPRVQEDLLKALHATGKPVILVLTGGAALAVNWADENLPAIIETWYPGEEGGTALADVLFGDRSPAGRLPVTFYKSVEQLPPFDDYHMAGRTYRYFAGEPLYPFGYGLSYTRFTYDKLVVPKRARAGAPVTVKVRVTNAGNMDGDEVVQLYVKDVQASVPVPRRALQGFKRIRLRRGESQVVSFTLAPRQFSLIDSQFKRVVEPGEFEISVGGAQPGAVPTTTQVLTAKVMLTGAVFAIR